LDKKTRVCSAISQQKAMQLKRWQSSLQRNRNTFLHSWKDEREVMLIMVIHNSKAVHINQKTREMGKDVKKHYWISESVGTWKESMGLITTWVTTACWAKEGCTITNQLCSFNVFCIDENIIMEH
jgi:hypothetical protein